MAAYLSLRHKATGEIYTGRDLIKVDDMLCEGIGFEPDPKDWCYGWMNWAGFAMAVRSDRSVAHALAEFMMPDENDCHAAPNEPDAITLSVCQWFIDNFENSSFHGR
jgi:hypothetical protein